MKLPRLLKTTSFRMSALYLALVLICFAALGLTVYVLTGKMLERQLKTMLGASLLQLQSDYREQGVNGLIDEIREKETINGWNTPDYALIDPAGRQIAGALPRHAYKSGRQVFNGPPKQNDPNGAQIIHADALALQGGYLIVAGENGEYIGDFGGKILEAFAWGALLAIAIFIPCGLYLSRSFLDKIESLTRSTQAIIGGDLTHRLSVSRTGDELDRLAALINRMLDRISALIENVQQVSNDIAHDLRTPVSRLRQHLDEAQRAELPPAEYRALFVVAITEVDTILATFSALLRIAQIETGSRRAGFKNVDLSALVAGIADVFSPVADENGKTLSTEIGAGIGISGDAELLTQMIFNLVENAVQHGGYRIGIRLQPDGTAIRLTIADDGTGIPDAQYIKVFQRFYRIDRSRNTPGNGLGLSIAKAIAELHGTAIGLSDNGPGLKASIIFPREDKQT